jgi:hypothetical protein
MAEQVSKGACHAQAVPQPPSGVGIWGSRDNSGEGKGDHSDGEVEIGVDMGVIVRGDQLGDVDGGGIDGSGEEGDGVSQERGNNRRLESSLPSLNNSTSHRLFLVHFAGGELGGGDSAIGCVLLGGCYLSVHSLSMVVELQCWQRRRRLGMFVATAVVCVSESGRKVLFPGSQ